MGAQKKGASRGSEDPEELARVPLQAILLADSFTTKFRPITLERPKVCIFLSHSLILYLYIVYMYHVCICEFMHART